MRKRILVAAGCAVLVLGAGKESRPLAHAASSGRYDDLVQLFQDWRAFQKPRVVDGVPDYTAAAMQAQRARLPELRKRLDAIDTTGWPIAERVDHRLVAAEMNGLDFDHRVLRPWLRDPCFYTLVFASETDVPAREGPVIEGAIELWQYGLPLAAERKAELQRKLRAIPPILDQAKKNLVPQAHDLWMLGIRVTRDESGVLDAFAKKTAPQHPDLASDALRAKRAVDDFRSWLEASLPRATSASGIGIQNYDWYLKNVHLSPYTWRDEVTLHERELGRATAQLKLEEARNASLPPLQPAADAPTHERRLQEAVTEYLRFLREQQLLTIKDYMDKALRARVSSFQAAPDRDFFAQVDHRDALVMRCHGTHWFDRARGEQEPHASPIRRVPLLYNIWDSRAEGLATAMEEMMMTRGLLDSRPRSRELVYILVANRAARGLAGLRVHSGEMTVEQAVRFAHDNTPYGWLKADGDTVWGEQQLYLEQPGYGSSYLAGKAQIESLLAERSRQTGDRFTLRQFMDEFHAAGMMPVSMIRWEMTGREDEAERLAR